MLKEDQSSYGTYSSSNSKQSQDFSSDSSKFYLKCGIFACITITALILMAMYHSQSTVSSATNDNNIISPLHAMTRRYIMVYASICNPLFVNYQYIQNHILCKQ